jgi:hypothetical protein
MEVTKEVFELMFKAYAEKVAAKTLFIDLFFSNVFMSPKIYQTLGQMLNCFAKEEVKELWHFTEKPCDELEYGDKTLCFCHAGDKYYVNLHVIGFCPWKTNGL